jgi:hypothetical protein
MAVSGDIVRARGVKVEFDDDFDATGLGGCALIDRVVRRLGLRSTLNQHLPMRSGSYSSALVCEQVIEGLLCGGRGFQATEVLRRDSSVGRIFGHERVAEEATVYRTICDIAGLDQRLLDEAYAPAGADLARLDIFGNEKRQRRHRRVVSPTPESMPSSNWAKMSRLLRSVGERCGESLDLQTLSLMGFVPVHGDGTDLEVRGRCFDAAEKNREGNMALKLMSVSVGPLYAAVDVMKGATDEGNALPALVAESGPMIDKLRGSRRALGLFDAAFAERGVVEVVNALDWLYVVCANQWRECLERLVQDLLPGDWYNLGPDSSRGWATSEVAVFKHMPEGWAQPQTVVVRRWRKDDEINLDVWHYAFLYTNVTPQDLPKAKLKRYGYAQLLWLLYGTKQGHEYNYKILLSDLGMHHPPSGRLGATQAFALLCAVAANVMAVIARKVVPAVDRGIRGWRFLRDYIAMAGRVVMGAGRILLVKLAGATLDPVIKLRWMQAWQNASRL